MNKCHTYQEHCVLKDTAEWSRGRVHVEILFFEDAV